MYQFSGKTDNFFGQIWPKILFWGRNFEILCPDFVRLCLEKLPNYVRYLGSYNVEDVAESKVEAEMSWVEVDGAGWSWVYGLAIPVTEQKIPQTSTFGNSSF